MFGSWFFPFWHDEWNILDFVVVGVSFVGYILKGPAVAVIRLVAAPLSALLLLCQPLCTMLLYLHVHARLPPRGSRTSAWSLVCHAWSRSHCCAGTGSRFQDGTAVQGGAQPGLITNSNECLGRLHCSSLQRLRAAHDRHLHLRHLSHRLLCKRPARVLRQLCSVTLYALSNGNWRLVVFSGRHRVNVRAACLSFLPPRRVARSQVQLLQSDFCPGPRRLTSRYHELSRSRGRFCRTRGKTTRLSCSFSRPT